MAIDIINTATDVKDLSLRWETAQSVESHQCTALVHTFV
jgi:hypothetical protein